MRVERILDPYDAGVCDGRVVEEDGFEFGRGELEAGDFDKFLSCVSMSFVMHAEMGGLRAQGGLTFNRSTIQNHPLSSVTAISPVLSQPPSSIVSAVALSFF